MKEGEPNPERPFHYRATRLRDRTTQRPKFFMSKTKFLWVLLRYLSTNFPFRWNHS
jgi:hypothetical protein